MTQQKAASLTSSLFARKGKASPASLLISEMQASGVDTLEREPVARESVAWDEDPAVAQTAPEAKAANGRTAGPNGSASRRKAKAAEAELPLLAFVEAQTATAAGDEEPDEVPEAAPARELPPAASLLERGAQSLRRTNGRAAMVVAEQPKSSAPPAAVEAVAAPDSDAALDESLEPETVSGDANVAAIEDAPQDDAPDHDAPDHDAADHDAADHQAAGDTAAGDVAAGQGAAAVSAAKAAEEAIEDAELVEPEAPAAGETVTAGTPESDTPAKAAEEAPAAEEKAAQEKAAQEMAARPWTERKADSGAAISATVALRNAAALNGAVAGLVMPADDVAGKAAQKAASAAPPPAARASALPWRSAAVVVLGAMLGLGGYLAFSGGPEQPAGDAANDAPAAVTAATPAEPAASPQEPAAVEAPGATSAPAPQAAAPLPQAVLPEPSFDVIRIEPDGQSIIAGRAQPHSEWILLNNGTPIASVRADANGEWVVLPDASLVPGANAFSLVPKTERGKIAIPAPQAQTPEAAPAAPASGAGADEGAVEGGSGGEPGVALPKPKPQAAAAAQPVSPVAFRVSPDGSYEVQVASVRQSSDAERERSRLAVAFPALLGKLDLRVQEASVEGSGTFFRVRSGAIADLGVAREVCRQLEAAGQGCLVVRRPATPDAPQTEVVEDSAGAPSPANQQAEVPQ